MTDKTYIAIDLKSFYASVECVERKLDPLTTNLVVADTSRTEKTICLAVSPSLKSYGIGGRPRLFEVRQKMKNINLQRQKEIRYHPFTGESYSSVILQKDPYAKADFLIAVPRMSFYMQYSTKIYEIYLRYIAPEDIHVYSIDEVFIDVSDYLKLYPMSPHDLARKMIQEVYRETGITATAGIGTNLYLAKVAMDIVAKHVEADQDGVRIAELDEMTYRKLLWGHKPITDFWRVGRGYAKRLEKYQLFTMGDIARFSLKNDYQLYDEFGVNAELLIDHAWGYEPCTIKDIKAYKPENHSIGNGQVLMRPYFYEEAEIIVREMTDNLVLQLVEKNMMTNAIGLYIGYDTSNLEEYANLETKKNWYGRTDPKPADGIIHLKQYTSSTRIIMQEALKLYRRIANPSLSVRRINISFHNILDKEEARKITAYEQMDLFSVPEPVSNNQEDNDKEEKLQKALLDIKHKYGKNAVLKGTSLQKAATGRERNKQIGGHRE